MSRTIATSILLLVLAAGLAAQKPGLVIEGGGWTFGRVDQSQRLEKTLAVKNTSRRPILIKEIQQTCGCIQASMDQMEVPAGGTVDLKLVLLASRGEGEVKKFVIIKSNDPFQPTIQLPMTGHIDPIWWPDFGGHLIDFGEVKNGATVVKNFRVRVREGFELEKMEGLVHPSGSCLSLEKTEVKDEDGRKAWDFKLTLGGRMETGSFDGMLRLDTDFAPTPFRGYRIVAEIVSSTEVTPSALNLGRLEKGKPWTGRILVTKTLGEGLEIPSFFCADPRVKLEKTELEKGKRFEIAVTLTPAADDQEIRGEITLVLEEPGQRIVKIVYHGRQAD